MSYSQRSPSEHQQETGQDLSMLMALCLLSLILRTAVPTVSLRALEMSLIPSALRRRPTVVALKSKVKITMPAVWKSTCKQLVRGRSQPNNYIHDIMEKEKGDKAR